MFPTNADIFDVRDWVLADVLYSCTILGETSMPLAWVMEGSSACFGIGQHGYR